MMKLVEEAEGLGHLLRGNERLGPVRYAIRRYQGIHENSGLPIPGLFRTEGTIDMTGPSAAWLDVPLTLKLADGRGVGIVIADETGRVLSEGHGPLKCMCC
jgi:hypothetical protein